MAFIGSYVNGDYLHDVLNNVITAPNWTSGIKGALFTDAITGQNAGATERYAIGAYSTNEVPDSGTYVEGGASLVTPSLVTPSGGRIVFNDTGATKLEWTSVTFTGADQPHGVIIYNDDIASPNADAVIASINFGVDIPVTAGTLTVNWDAVNGIFYIQYA